MNTPINLNHARKRRAKTSAQKQSDENRVKFGRTKSQKQSDMTMRNKAASDLEGKKFEN